MLGDLAYVLYYVLVTDTGNFANTPCANKQIDWFNRYLFLL